MDAELKVHVTCKVSVSFEDKPKSIEVDADLKNWRESSCSLVEKTETKR